MKTFRIFFVILLFLFLIAKPMAGFNQAFAYQEPKVCKSVFDEAKKTGWQQSDLPSDQCPITCKIIYWQKLLSPAYKATAEKFKEIFQFLKKNPHWPKRKKLQKKAEEALEEDAVNSKIILEWFAKNPPLTIKGIRSYIRALLTYNQVTKAQLVVRNAWVEQSFTNAQGKEFYDEFKEMISKVDTRSRVDCLLAKEKTGEAQAMFPFLDEGYQKLSKARISLIKKRSDFKKKMAAIPDYLKNHPGLAFDLIRYYRRKDDPKFLDTVVKLFAPIKPNNQQLYPNQWWKERSSIARQLLFKRRYKEAFLIASSHSLKEGQSYAAAEWLSGWLETRFLKNPKGGLARFSRLYQKVKTPISKARAGYWAGIAAQQLGRKKEARSWFQKASQHPATYYGQLAQGKIGKSKHPELQPMPIVLKNTPNMLTMMKSFDNRELVKAIYLLHSFKQTQFMELFFNALSSVVIDQTEQLLLIDLAQDKGSTYLGVDTAIKSSKSIVHMIRESYPTLDFIAKFDFLLEPALIHAIIRRESRFHPSISSSAGATGLMQIMPATAREVSRREKIKFSSLKNPYDNVVLGTSYVNFLLEQYDYSLVLTLAAYNAGPSPVNRWIKEYGDPRTSIDPADWVEHIPYYETRNYVQRVLENYMIYRSRFDAISKPLQSLMQDYRNVKK